MIRKLKRRLIALSMTALTILLAIIVAGMNLISYSALTSEADTTLSLLSQNKGRFPDQSGAPEKHKDDFPRGMSPELPYESRYFSVLLNDSGNVIFSETSKIAAVDSEAAIHYARSVLERGATSGFADQFRFLRTDDDAGTRIIFLDCGRKLDSFFTFLYASLAMSLVGIAAVFCVILFFAGRIIRPIAESYEKQKRFITDAGHEIKTPLTIISANVDLLEMDLGENESLEDIRQQTTRLRLLTDDLVLLARMEETGNALPKIEFPLSEVAEETLRPFQTLAEQQNKTVTCSIEPLVALNGNDKAIGQLFSILMENALKYAPTGTNITFALEKQSKSVRIIVQNSTETPMSSDDLIHIFDRFYRTDHSRNSETGGHGIGLSLAKAIVTAHGGKIHADAPDPQRFRITVILPA